MEAGRFFPSRVWYVSQPRFSGGLSSTYVARYPRYLGSIAGAVAYALRRVCALPTGWMHYAQRLACRLGGPMCGDTRLAAFRHVVGRVSRRMAIGSFRPGFAVAELRGRLHAATFSRGAGGKRTD